MQSIVPYSKEIKFNSKISEICSISLEQELDIKEREITGNFIIAGEYKSHEISINKEPFNYKLPFNLEVSGKLDKNTVEFEITDFSYEIKEEDYLKVDIEFSVKADLVEEKEFEVEEKQPEENREISYEFEDLFKEEEEKIEPVEIEAPEEKEEQQTEEIELVPEEKRLDIENTEAILDTATTKEDEFITYNIHIVSESDTLESIVALYQTDLDTIKNYNQIETLNVGDKIIIPCLDE